MHVTRIVASSVFAITHHVTRIDCLLPLLTATLHCLLVAVGVIALLAQFMNIFVFHDSPKMLSLLMKEAISTYFHLVLLVDDNVKKEW